MTTQEAIAKREELLAEERKINHAIRVLESDTIPRVAGITMALGQYRRRLNEITEEIRACADAITPTTTTEQQSVTAETPIPTESQAPTTELTLEEKLVAAIIAWAKTGRVVRI